MTATESLSFAYDCVLIGNLKVSSFITQCTNNLSLHCKHTVVNSFMIQESLEVQQLVLQALVYG